MIRPTLFAAAALTALAAACSQPDGRAPAKAQPSAAPAPPSRPAAPPPTPTKPQPPPAAPAASSPTARQIDDAAFSPLVEAQPGATAAGGRGGPPDPMLVKAQVLLARAGFSPGEVDGRLGSNFKHAVIAFARSHDVQTDGDLTQAVWDRLTSQEAHAPVAGSYTLTEADVSGPWSPETHDNLAKDKGLPRLGYTHATEALGERFHMSEDLLKALNPGVDFTRAGAAITVAQVGDLHLAAVDHVDVDKAHAQVRAYGADGALLAAFPATVGSRERPSPSGVRKVVVVKRDPLYTYDPRKLTWGPKRLGRFIIRAGPNNPVGAVWMGLNAPGYGLHGTPEPHLIGKTASHGCVRMTNWDAVLLSTAVKPGVKVAFVNARAKA